MDPFRDSLWILFGCEVALELLAKAGDRATAGRIKAQAKSHTDMPLFTRHPHKSSLTLIAAILSANLKTLWVKLLPLKLRRCKQENSFIFQNKQLFRLK